MPSAPRRRQRWPESRHLAQAFANLTILAVQAGRLPELLFEYPAEMRGIVESPVEGDLGDSLGRLPRIEEVCSAAVQTASADPMCEARSRGLEQPMQMTHRDSMALGDGFG